MDLERVFVAVLMAGLVILFGVIIFGITSDHTPAGYYFSGKGLMVSVPWGPDISVHDCDGTKLQYVIDNDLMLPKNK